MSKIDRACKKLSYTRNLRGNAFKEIFYGTWSFQQSSMISIGRHVGGQTLVLQHACQPKLLFAYILLNV